MQPGRGWTRAPGQARVPGGPGFILFHVMYTGHLKEISDFGPGFILFHVMPGVGDPALKEIYDFGPIPARDRREIQI